MDCGWTVSEVVSIAVIDCDMVESKLAEEVVKRDRGEGLIEGSREPEFTSIVLGLGGPEPTPAVLACVTTVGDSELTIAGLWTVVLVPAVSVMIDTTEGDIAGVKMAE